MKRITILTGHYGSGKTTIAVNFAKKLALKDKNVSLIDMDIVNPYFRAADLKNQFENEKINFFSPCFAGTNLDIPSVGFDVESIISKSEYIIADIGGDDSGAKILGCYSHIFENYHNQMDMLCVINCFRPMTATPMQTVKIISEIENASRLCHTGIINNSSFGVETSAKDIKQSEEYAQKVSELANLPVVFTTCLKESPVNIFPKMEIELILKPSWENIGKD